MSDSQYFIPHLEWESIPFPLTITKLTTNESLFGFAENSIITIERTDNYKLAGTIAGTVLQPATLNQENYIGKGNIIEGCTLFGEDEKGNVIELTNCHLVSYHTNSLNKTGDGYYMQGSLIAGKVTITYREQDKVENYKRLDWFICSKLEAHFWEITIRRRNPEVVKIRKGIDIHPEVNEMNPGGSWSKDYTKIDLADFSFIISKVPEKIFDGALHGLCFEFRYYDNFKIPDESTINQIKKFISFILGNKLTHTGYSIINNNQLQKAVCYSLKSESLRLSAKTPIPPITFNTKYKWVLTRVCEVLFNRILLKLLGYDDYYTDYSLQNSPLKHISKNAGTA